MKPKTVLKGAAIVGGIVAVGMLFKLVAIPVLVTTLVVAVVTYFWKKFVDFWLDKLQVWVDKYCGRKICAALGEVIAFLNTPISGLRKGSKMTIDAVRRIWDAVRPGLANRTRYMKDGEDVIIETRMADSETEIIVQKRKPFYDLPAKVRTDIICHSGQCYEIDNNHDIIDRKFAEMEKQLSQ